MPYQVKDWQIHFENDRSRVRDQCRFVCVPNKQHGMGFSHLMAEKDGAAIYGIWQLILGACSQQKRPRNGWLTSDGDSKGIAWGVDDLALKFRRPVAEIRRAIEVLCSAKIGWLLSVQDVEVDKVVTTPLELPTNSPPTPPEWKGKEGNRMEGKESLSDCDSDKEKLLADEIYQLYPRKVGKPDATRAILKQLKDFPFDTLKDATTKLAGLWSGHDTTYLAHPATWFNQQRFNDEPETWGPKLASANGKPQLKPNYKNGF